MTPFSGGFNFTPPQSVTDTLSPVSNQGDSPAFNFSPNPMNGDRRGNPFVGNNTPSFTSHPHIPRLQIHDRMQRTRSESLSSPLRTSMSYSAGGSDMTGTADPSLQPLHSAPIGGEHQGENGQNNNMMPYGIGYNCKYVKASSSFDI